MMMLDVDSVVHYLGLLLYLLMTCSKPKTHIKLLNKNLYNKAYNIRFKFYISNGIYSGEIFASKKNQKKITLEIFWGSMVRGGGNLARFFGLQKRIRVANFF